MTTFLYCQASASNRIPLLTIPVPPGMDIGGGKIAIDQMEKWCPSCRC